MKGKGNGPSFHIRSRRSALSGMPVLTRLTGTMGFVEIAQSMSALRTSGAFDEDVPDVPDSPDAADSARIPH